MPKRIDRIRVLPIDRKLYPGIKRIGGPVYHGKTRYVYLSIEGYHKPRKYVSFAKFMTQRDVGRLLKSNEYVWEIGSKVFISHPGKLARYVHLKCAYCNKMFKRAQGVHHGIQKRAKSPPRTFCSQACYQSCRKRSEK